jgi:hypothetical protein
MRELEKQREKFRIEKDKLDNLSDRIDKRRSDLHNQLKALDQLIAGAETLERSAIPDDLLESLDKYLPPLNGEDADTVKPFTPVAIRRVDPQNKTLMVLSLFYANNITSHARGYTTRDVVTIMHGVVTPDDVHKVLSRQSRPEAGRLSKQDRKFHLTPAGIKYVEELAEREKED